MPIYEYLCKCEKCNKTTEHVFPIKDIEKVVICPECGCIAEKIISKSSFVLNGKWFKDGY